MFRNEYTARIGFVKTLDRTCPTHKGMYSSAEKTHCPKCNAPLVQFTVTTKRHGVRPQCLSEIVIYPIYRPEDEKIWESRTERAGGFGMQIRVNLWGRYDDERKIAYPDNRVQYLQPKRIARFCLNTKPLLKAYTSNKDGVPKQMIEMKYEFNQGRGDQIEFLDKPAEHEAMTTNAGAQPAPHEAATGTPVDQPLPVNQPAKVEVPASTDAVVAIGQELMNLVKRFEDAVGTPSTHTQPASEDEILKEAASQSPPADMDHSEDGIGKVEILSDDEPDPFPVG